MTQNKTKKVDYVSIDCDSNYFNTLEQIKLRSVHWFLDATSPSKLKDKNAAVGFFSNRKIKKEKLEIVSGSSLYNVSEIVVDSSGNNRKILSSNSDFFSGSILDSYKNGVEITQEKHWTAGLVKITAGTPGHLYDRSLFGVNEFDLVSRDIYYEIDSFNPVNYLLSRGSSEDEEYSENIVAIHEASDASILSMNGTIEPIPIRSVVFGTSINFPFEPQGIRGELESGNPDLFGSTDLVLSVQEREDLKNKKPVFFLDVVDALGIKVGTDTVTATSSSVGAQLGYISSEVRQISPFNDEIPPRGNKISSTYEDELKSVVERMKPRETSYLSEKQFSSACGFVNESSESGVESIAYSNIAYGTNSSHRSLKRSLLFLRDSESFLEKNTEFNDNNTINFSSQIVEYPAMLPSSYVSSSMYMNDAVRSIVYRSGAINVSRIVRPGCFDQVLQDSILEGKRRMGTL